MSQLTFAEAEYAIKKRTTRREKFLAQLEQLVPWQKLNQQLSKGYKKAGPGRPPYPLETMVVPQSKVISQAACCLAIG